MRVHLNLRYSKVINLALKANEERCRVLRQLCALKVLEVTKTPKRVINIDETEVDRFDFRRRAW